MKIQAQKDLHTIHKIITSYYNDYDIIHNGKVTEDTYFLVIEKFFFRNSSRASLSIVLTPSDDQLYTIIQAIGSGGGQGMIFKFDWGAKESFEGAIPRLLNQNNIAYQIIE